VTHLTLPLLTLLLSSIRLALRSCWDNVSAERCEARRRRRLSKMLTLC